MAVQVTLLNSIYSKQIYLSLISNYQLSLYFKLCYIYLMKFLDQDKERDKKQKTKKIYKQTTAITKQENIFYNIENPSCKVQCDGCQKDISKFTKISVGQIDYCVTCFSNIDQFPQTYSIINKIDFPLFELEWSAEQQLLMFEALQRYGFGNWNQIAEHMGTDRSKQQVEKHYQNVYLSTEQFLPIDKQILAKRDPDTQLLIAPKVLRNQIKRGRKPKQQDLNPQQLSNPIQRGSIGSNTANTQTLINTGHAGEIVGYMPQRGDFQVQYDNDAQLLLAEMQFNDDDKQQQKQMKYKLLDIYNCKLTERTNRKNFVIERKLLDLKYQAQIDKNRTKEQRQIYNMMKVFSRFNTAQKHEQLVQSLIRQKQIRQKIQELRNYKKMGLKTFAQVEKFLQQKKRKQELRLKKQKNTEINVSFDNKSSLNARRTRTTSVFQGNNKLEKRNLALSSQQTKICQQLAIPAQQYIAIKQSLVRQCLKQGFLKRQSIEQMFRLEKEKLFKIFDYLVVSNTILSK